VSKISEHIGSLSAKKRALLALRVGSKIDLKEPLKTEPVAIIGMGCRFPGARNPETFWRLLRDGVDAITEIPPDRWNADAYYDPDRNAPGKMITRWGGFLEEADRFDPLFFNISPREAESMDPQQRILMKVSWEALENAGQPVDRLAGSQTGVFIGIMGNDYLQSILKYSDPLSIDSHMSTGNSFSIAAGRLSYFLGLQGPSMAVDTACSSSSVAVHLACQSLNSGECRLALAGGVNLVMSPEITIMLSKVGLLGSHPCCKTFDAEADGFVRGEGCGIVVLKRLSDAFADGDNILAVLRSTAVNQDGRSSGLTAPNERAHKAVIREALSRAGVEPSRVSYVEAHGTASRLGDAVELQALSKVLGKGRSENQHLFIGSVKTNVGHLESASGMAAIIKVVLSLIHGEIPPHLHLKEMNPLISLEETPVVIPMERIPWPSENGRHIAGVNAFGFSGTNAFMVLEEAPVRQEVRQETERPLHLLTLSAKSEKALMKLVKRFETHLGEHASESLSDICFTANAGRSHFPYRLAVVVESSKQLRERIGAFAAGTKPTGLVSGHVQTGSRPKVAFVFTGQGCQYVGMGRQLYYTQPSFHKAFNRCAEILKSQIDRPLLPVIFEKEGNSSVLDETGYAQPALFALEYALAEMWQSWGVDPFVVMGHDEGEYVAACVAGVLSLEDGLKLIAARSRMTVSTAQKKDRNAIPASFKEILSEVNFSAPRLKMISGITGELADINELRKPEYWQHPHHNHARFLSGMQNLQEPGYNVFIEIGQDPILIEKGQGHLSPKAVVLLPSLKKGREDWQQLLESLSELYIRGLDVDWNGFDRSYARHRIPLPTYPFERERYWISRSKVSINRARTAELPHPLLGYRVHAPFKEILFESRFSSNAIFLDQHRVYDLATMSGSSFLQMAIAGASEAFGEEPCVLENMTLSKALYVPESGSRTVQLMLTPEDSGIAPFKIFSMEPNGDSKQASWTLHATGRLRVGQADNTTFVPEDVSLEEVKARCPEEVSASEFYREMWENGLQLGHYFKWNEKIWRGDQDVLAQMRFPTTGDKFEAYQIHPGLIDSCAQLLAISLTSKADSVYMFLGCDSYRFYARADGQLWCHLVFETVDPGQEVISGKYRLFNEFGEVVVEATGVHSKRVTREALESIIRAQDISNWSSKDERLSAEQAEFLRRMQDMPPEERTDLVLARIRSNVVTVLRLDPSKPLDLQQPLTELGLNSLLILELKNRLESHMGIDLPLADFLKSPNLKNMANLALSNLSEPSSLTLSSSALPQITPALDKRHLPFPLTDVQRAYWIGRSEAFELGNVPCHVYMEVELIGFDVDRFNQAFLHVIKRHDMLRAVILPDGLQHVLEEVPPYKIEVLDLRGEDPEKMASQVEAIRSRMSHQEFAVDRWPLFEIRASLLDDQRIRLHISIDFLIADGLSFMIIIQELAELYRNPDISLPLLDLTFRDYVLAERDLRDSDIYQRSLDYWRGRLESIPPAPELPISKNSSSVSRPRFKRRSAMLDQETWLRLKSRGGRAGLTPSGVLLAAFAEILAVWSKSPRFTINVTIFNRFPLHPQVDQIVGDFTRLILLAVENLTEETFELRARAIQQQLWRDMEHSYVSGVQVLSDMGRRRGENARVYMPVVFTSLLPLGTSRYTQADFLPAGIPLDVIYCISQTPQVWLDYQVVEKDGALVVIWDAVEDLFPKGLLDDMLQAHCHLLKRLADDENAWQETTRQLISAAQLEKRAAVNATDAPISSEMFHTLFTAQVSKQPDHPAVVSSRKTLSFKELFHHSNQVGRLLREKGVQPNTLVAVVMEKGWEQVVSVLGILQSGAAYLPIDPTVPKERLRHLLDDGKVSLVLTQSWLDEKLEWPEYIQRFSVDTMELTDMAARSLDPVQGPDDLAYVIYTSGSTGLPKGVMIDHRGAVNTILDINQRFGVKPEDRVLSLANLNFDLSVYDIFGTLAAGGTIVLPEADKTKDPAHWLELMIQEQVTH
jgi:acyl transferase domain-containing protein/non-ribosomal peptide synthetase component F/acyl carrier protein